MCGAGTDCGSCIRTVEDLIEEHVEISTGSATVAA
jgi:bacterioferritin-associated ferredoxin